MSADTTGDPKAADVRSGIHPFVWD
jgi:hypothetical protein